MACICALVFFFFLLFHSVTFFCSIKQFFHFWASIIKIPIDC